MKLHVALTSGYVLCYEFNRRALSQRIIKLYIIVDALTQLITMDDREFYNALN
jgi:hypothetical protein